jgi:anti-anti-sigma factor
MGLTVTSKEQRIGVFTVYPVGSLDSNTFQVLEKKIHMLKEGSPKAVVLDLKDLTYISSAGIRVILATKKALKAIGADLYMTHLQPQIRKVFDIIKAAPTLSIFGNVEELDAYLDRMQQEITSRSE